MSAVKDYQGKKEYLVLSMVKKYPLYSVNKLAEELPGISRHSIQRILEKNNLSRVEDRLEFAAEKRERLKSLPILERLKKRILGFFRRRKLDLEGVKKLSKKFQEKPRAGWRLPGSLAVLLVLVLIFWQGASFISAKPPKISLDRPETGFVNESERLFVIGKVVPKNCRVTVNGHEVSLNGDGSFTAVVNIPMGESILEVGAINRRREAKVLRLVKRVPTKEELQAQEEEEVKKKLAAADKTAELDRTVKDLMAAKNAVMNPKSGKKGLLRILNNRIEEKAGFSSVLGEVVNLGKEAVSWVMITAKFFNETGGTVDTKYGFATDYGQVIKSGEEAEFEIQATKKEFDHYGLELSWEKGEVAGLATEVEEEATASGEIEEEVE